MAKVKVRIAVAVDHTGHWNSFGYDTQKDDVAMAYACEDVQEGEACYWVEAELDIPERTITTVEGTVAPEIPHV